MPATVSGAAYTAAGNWCAALLSDGKVLVLNLDPLPAKDLAR